MLVCLAFTAQYIRFESVVDQQHDHTAPSRSYLFQQQFQCNIASVNLGTKAQGNIQKGQWAVDNVREEDLFGKGIGDFEGLVQTGGEDKCLIYAWLSCIAAHILDGFRVNWDKVVIVVCKVPHRHFCNPVLFSHLSAVHQHFFVLAIGQVLCCYRCLC